MSVNLALLQIEIYDYKSVTEEHWQTLREFASQLQAMVEQCNEKLDAETEKTTGYTGIAITSYISNYLNHREDAHNEN
jgi:hypothetical protein